MGYDKSHTFKFLSGSKPVLKQTAGSGRCFKVELTDPCMTDIVNKDVYQPPGLLRNRHFNTIFTNFLRKDPLPPSQDFTLFTPDNDFLAGDYYTCGSNRLIVAFHGLEGNSTSTYMLSLARAALSQGYDMLAMNFRGCGRQSNNLLISYHSGKSDDVHLVMNEINSRFDYEQIVLTGFSLGGNVVTKYGGEHQYIKAGNLKAIAAVSVPFDLEATALHMERWQNKLYLWHLLMPLKQKARQKIRQFPESPYRTDVIKDITTFYAFDDYFTAPVHGFGTAPNYYRLCSSKQFIALAERPTLLINALDDPFFPEACYPFEESEQNDRVFFLAPSYGGHVGFSQNVRFSEMGWHEKQLFRFLQELI